MRGLTLRDVAAPRISVPLFDPATLSPTLWLDSTDAATFTLSTTSVDAWASKGSVTASFVNGGGGRPTRNGTVNGRTSVVFDGTANYLTVDFGTDTWSASTWTCWMVVQNTAGGAFPRIFGGRRNATGANDYDSPNAVYGYLPEASVAAGTSTLNSICSGTNATGGGTTANAGVGAPFCARSRYDGSKVYIELNGTENSGATASAPGAMRYLRIGAHLGTASNPPAAGSFFKGDMCEILMIASGTPSGTDVTNVESYITSRWGVVFS